MSGLDGLSREELIGIVLGQAATIEELTRRVEALEAELEKLRPGGGASAAPAPDWVKPNRKERRAEGRKKRKSSFVRRKAVCPTKVVCHAPETCPDCNRKLSGGWVHRTREVIDIPSVPVEITHHQIIARRCGVCGRRVVPKVDFSGVCQPALNIDPPSASNIDPPLWVILALCFWSLSSSCRCLFL